MIAEVVKVCKVEEMLVAKQFRVASKSNKIREWLKLLSMHQENQDYVAKEIVIRDHMHYLFILNEDFWLNEIDRKFAQPDSNIEDAIQFAMLALEDGMYIQAAQKIYKRMVQALAEKQLRFNYVVAKMEKLVSHFDHHRSFGSYFFKKLRDIYAVYDRKKQVRELYQRQLALGLDNFDIVHNQYALWEQEQPEQDRPSAKTMQKLFEDANEQWQDKQSTIATTYFSSNNPKASLQERLSEPTDLILLEIVFSLVMLLATQNDKMHYLRRICLKDKLLWNEYLERIEIYHQENEEEIIRIYQATMQIIPNFMIEVRYLYFLIRRINKHLIQAQNEDYAASWQDKVIAVRDFISEGLNKKRKDPKEQQTVWKSYINIAIDMQQRIIKDKAAVMQLYESILLRDSKVQNYEHYAQSLIDMEAYRDAGNIFKRCLKKHQTSQTYESYERFVLFYGQMDDIRGLCEMKSKERTDQIRSNLAESQKRPSKTVQDDKIAPTVLLQGQVIATPNDKVNINGQKQSSEQVESVDKLKRDRNSYEQDITSEKIEAAQRKKVHVDSSRTVFLKGIPTTWDKPEILNILKYQFQVSDIRIVVKNNQQKDYCYIDYESEEFASKQVTENQTGYQMDLSRPPSHYDESLTLFLCALPSTATKEKILDLFENYRQQILQVRMKMSNDKNYAYIDFNQLQHKQHAYEEMSKNKLLIDGKKIIIQECDSDRMRNKKFIKVVFLKNLAFKATEEDIRNFFAPRVISKLSYPKNPQSKKPMGFAYVQFEKFKDYQQALDLHNGSLHGRVFEILKSDRQINMGKEGEDNANRSVKQPKIEPRQNTSAKNGSDPTQKQKSPTQRKERDNSYFQNMFK